MYEVFMIAWLILMGFAVPEFGLALLAFIGLLIFIGICARIWYQLRGKDYDC